MSPRPHPHSTRSFPPQQKIITNDATKLVPGAAPMYACILVSLPEPSGGHVSL